LARFFPQPNSDLNFTEDSTSFVTRWQHCQTFQPFFKCGCAVWKSTVWIHRNGFL